jgi:hypothetical protein
MSKQKKVRRDRRPNISTAINVSVAAGTTGVELPRAPAPDRKTTGAVFDYSHVKKDLRRIGILAASFITIFVILSFFLNR